MTVQHRWGLVGVLGTALVLVGCATPDGAPLRQRNETVRQELYAGVDLSPTSVPDLVSLDDYVQFAFKHNARLRAAFDRWQAALERIPQSRSLDDPSLSFEYFIEQVSKRYQVSLTQVFPAWGTLRGREDRSVAEATAAMHAFEAERFDLFGRVAKAVYEYEYLARETGVTEENLQLLASLEQVIDTRFQSGSAPFGDLLKVQIEKDRLAERRASLLDQRRVQSSELSALLDLPHEAPLPWPKLAVSGSGLVDEKILMGLLGELNPELKGAEAMVEAARHEQDLARRSGWPGFMLGAGWEVMPGMNNDGNESDFSLMAGITLPLWRGRIRAGYRESGALLKAAVHERDGLRSQLRAELSTAIFEWRDAERRIALFQTSLIPKAEQVLAVEQRSYADGQTEFATLIEAQRTLLEFRLMAERAMADREIALADIGCCIGIFDVQAPGKEHGGL